MATVTDREIELAKVISKMLRELRGEYTIEEILISMMAVRDAFVREQYLESRGQSENE